MVHACQGLFAGRCDACVFGVHWVMDSALDILLQSNVWF